jgi:hypothetical protein
MRRYAPAFLDGCEAVKAMKEIKFARVRDFLGFNYLFVNPTSRVIRDEQLPEPVKNDTKLRDEALVEEALGEKASPVLRRAYAVMLGLSSHDLSAMRELLGMNKVLFCSATRRWPVYGRGLRLRSVRLLVIVCMSFWG